MEENKLLQKFFGLELHTLSKISVRRKAGDEGFFFNSCYCTRQKNPYWLPLFVLGLLGLREGL